MTRPTVGELCAQLRTAADVNVTALALIHGLARPLPRTEAYGWPTSERLDRIRDVVDAIDQVGREQGGDR